MGRFKSLRFDFYVFNFDTMKVILFGKSAEKPYGKLLLTKRNGTQVSYQYLRSDLNWLDNNDTVSYGCIRFALEPQLSERKNATLIKRVRQIGIYLCNEISPAQFDIFSNFIVGKCALNSSYTKYISSSSHSSPASAIHF